MKSKKMCIIILGIIVMLLAGAGSVTVIVDPFFHYHAPMEWQSYSLYNQRYQNDGITRHFEYDAMITGTSMTENFKTSQCNELFEVNSIKVPYSGASYEELNEAISRAIDYNSDLKMVVMGIDTSRLFVDKDYMRYEDYPEYLYDNNVFNDVNYFFNKEILLGDTFDALRASLNGKESTTFDAYSNWDADAVYGAEAVLSIYERPEKSEEPMVLTEEDKNTLQETFRQNLVSTIEANPEIDFYLFFPPYSILYWDSMNQENGMERYIEGQKLAIEMLVPYDNVHLFSFYEEYEMICDLDNYKDWLHYSQKVSDQIMQWMCGGNYQITEENYMEHIEALREFYGAYDYEMIFQ